MINIIAYLASTVVIKNALKIYVLKGTQILLWRFYFILYEIIILEFNLN